MNPADRYAALKLLESALKAELSTAAEEAESYRREVGAKALETSCGDVAITRRKPQPIIDPAALLAWAETDAPHLIQRTIPADTVAALKRDLVVDGDDVITRDGELVTWATVAPGSEFLTWRAPAERKAEAHAALAGWLDGGPLALTPERTTS